VDETVTPHNLRDLNFHFFGTAWVFLDADTLLLCGGDGRKNASLFDVVTGAVTNLPDMYQPRYGHGIYKLVDITYVFGGAHEKETWNTCEFYHNGRWGRLPWLPWKMYYVTTARVNDKIFITGTNNYIAVFEPLKVQINALPGMPKRDQKGDTILQRCSHKAFTDGENLLIIEKDNVRRINADSKSEEFGMLIDDPIEGEDPRCWIAGPPVYYEGKVFFATYIRSKSIYMTELAMPSVRIHAMDIFN
jgi:hypothetical protein